MQLKQLEAVLMMVLKLPQAGFPEFQARMRHLQNLDVPPRRRPGSGSKIGYNRADAQKLLVALTLGYDLFIKPSRAVEIVNEIDLTGGKFYVDAKDDLSVLLVNTPSLIVKLDQAIDATKDMPRRKSRYGKTISTYPNTSDQTGWHTVAGWQAATLTQALAAAEKISNNPHKETDTHEAERKKESRDRAGLLCPRCRRDQNPLGRDRRLRAGRIPKRRRLPSRFS